MRFGAIATLTAAASGAVAQEVYLGFNSGATKDDTTVKKQADFEKEFTAAQKLQSTPGVFNSVRLYTNIQPDTESPIEAFPAAVKTKTKLLLGMWTSGTTSIDKELNALTKAIDQYGKDFTDLVVGISVGSEDLYRSSADGVQNKAGVGQEAESIVGFIKDTREKLKGTALAKTPIGHVDTWTAWVNSSNKAVIDAVDWVGADLYPYYENGNNINTTNVIDNAAKIFQEALNRTENAAGDKPIWITETGWPATGPTWNDAVPSNENAKKYWDDVGCTLFGKTNTWWYTLRDSNPDNKPKFALDPNLDSQPLYNLSCPVKAGAPAPANTGSSQSTPTGAATDGTKNGGMVASRVNLAILGLSLVSLVAWVL